MIIKFHLKAKKIKGGKKRIQIGCNKNKKSCNKKQKGGTDDSPLPLPPPSQPSGDNKVTNTNQNDREKTVRRSLFEPTIPLQREEDDDDDAEILFRGKKRNHKKTIK
jgi:hypothetical protein